MRLVGWNIFKESTSIGHEFTEELIEYIKGLNYGNKEVDTYLNCLYLLSMKEDNELEDELKKWVSDNKYMNTESANELLYLLEHLDFSEFKKETMKKYVKIFLKNDFLEDNLVNLLPALYEGLIIYFQQEMGIKIKDVTYIDEYGSFRLGFNTVRFDDARSDLINKLSIEDIIDYESSSEFESNDVVRGVFIYRIDSDEEIIIPAIDSTHLILSKIVESVNFSLLKNIGVEKIRNIEEVREMLKDFMEDKIAYKGFRLETIGLYGHYHRRAGFKININIESFDTNNFDGSIISDETTLWDNNILEINDDTFLKKLKETQLDLFYSQMRSLYDSIFHDDTVSRKMPLRKFVFHFSYNNQDYTIIEISKLVKTNNNYNHNRMGVICRLGESGQSLSAVLKKSEEALNLFERGENIKSIKTRFQTPKIFSTA